MKEDTSKHTKTTKDMMQAYRAIKDVKVVIIVVALGILISFLGSVGHGILVVVVYFLTVESIKQASQKVFAMQSFAQKNGFSIDNEGLAQIEKLSGRQLGIGHSQYLENIISGTYQDFPVRIFHYTYITGSGKSARNYPWTVCEITAKDVVFPHILLRPKVLMGTSRMQEKYGTKKDVEISLGSEYQKDFRLYTTSEYEIEVLQIFSQELLERIRAHGRYFSIEFVDNFIYVYSHSYMRSEAQIQHLYEVVKMLLDSSGGLMRRLHDDFDVIHEAHDRRNS